MGGSGDGGGLGSRRELELLRKEAEEEIRAADLNADVLETLAEMLGEINGRDVEKISRYLEDIADCLGDAVDEFENLLFGGSVAKHTYVDGLSDVDSLVILAKDAGGATPSEVLSEFAGTLRASLDMSSVESIDVGQLAVTVAYKDGTSVQLLPAVRDGESLAIAGGSGDDWKHIRPKAFAEKLTAANQDCGRVVVPTIKLAKSAIAQLPEAMQVSGYHVEAMAVEAFSDYTGPRNPMAALVHLMEFSANRVLSSIQDATGQSSDIGAWLGAPGSSKRREVSAQLGRIANSLNNATSAEQWRETIAGES